MCCIDRLKPQSISEVSGSDRQSSAPERIAELNQVQISAPGSSVNGQERSFEYNFKLSYLLTIEGFAKRQIVQRDSFNRNRALPTDRVNAVTGAVPVTG